MFEVEGGRIGVAQGWRHGPTVDKGARWEPAELGPAVRDLLAQAEPPEPVYGAVRSAETCNLDPRRTRLFCVAIDWERLEAEIADLAVHDEIADDVGRQRQTAPASTCAHRGRCGRGGRRGRR